MNAGALAGLAIMIGSQASTLGRLEPFYSWNTPICWTGFILFADSLVYQARGRLWIEGATGRILRTELLLGTSAPRLGLSPIQIDTTFVYDETLDLVVPSEMKEFYPDARVGDVRGTATYSRFRRFTVSVEESQAR